MAIEPHAYTVILQVSKGYRDTLLKTRDMWQWITIDQSMETWKDELCLFATLSGKLPLHVSIMLPFDVEEEILSSIPRWKSLEIYVPEGMSLEEAALPIWRLFRKAILVLPDGLDWIQNEEPVIMYPLRVASFDPVKLEAMNGDRENPDCILDARRRNQLPFDSKRPELSMITTGLHIRVGRGLLIPTNDGEPKWLNVMPPLLHNIRYLRHLRLDFTDVISKRGKGGIEYEEKLMEIPTLTSLDLGASSSTYSESMNGLVQSLRVPQLKSLGLTGTPTLLISWIAIVHRHAKPRKLSITLLRDDHGGSTYALAISQDEWTATEVSATHVEIVFLYRSPNKQYGNWTNLNNQVLRDILEKCKPLAILQIASVGPFSIPVDSFLGVMEATHPNLVIKWKVGQERHESNTKDVQNFFASASSTRLVISQLNSSSLVGFSFPKNLTSLEISPVDLGNWGDGFTGMVFKDQLTSLVTLTCTSNLARYLLRLDEIPNIVDIRILTAARLPSIGGDSVAVATKIFSDAS